MKNFKRQTLENEASQLGYDLSEASSATRMRAASKHEPLPRWELNQSDNLRADEMRACGTLADVASELDNIRSRDAW